MTSPPDDPFEDLPREPLPRMDAPAPVHAQPKRLADHRMGECIWPLGPAEAEGDWRTLFCCAPATRRRYCAEHAQRAFQPEDEVKF